MRKYYDFSGGQRGPVLSSPSKTRITIMLDNDIVDAFRQQASAQGIGYQTAINQALRAAIDQNNAPVTERKLREILRTELSHLKTA
ncbi:BrnA antitoxin family protein [Thiorhodospira sibirica]|uniref:BrnA antitoxin family protein n=1 Tax=Thiorhodospira sibirica TaxID=154347 RepID=UPI00022C048E|nr:BrnA antitoxin family protein [Thiorhodospira sibirica]